MKKGAAVWIDPILLIGLFISITITVLLVWSGNDTLSGLIVGLLSTIITLLIDLIGRLQKAEKTFLDVARFEQILANPWVGKILREQTELYSKIYSFKFPHFNRIAEAATSEFQMRLAEIASGEVVVPTKTDLEYSGAIGLNEVQREAKFIHADILEFWKTPFGLKILELDRQAIRRKVRITRVFPLPEPYSSSDLNILKTHADAGIRVLVIDPNRISSEFAIFDDRVVVEYNIQKDNYGYERIIIDPSKVKRKTQEYDFLMQYARPLRDIAPPMKELK
jgi:hypothetical protein